MLGQPVIAELPAAILRPRPTAAVAVPSNEILPVPAYPQAGSLLPGARQGVSEGEERERLLLRGIPVLLQPVRPKLQVSQTVHVHCDQPGCKVLLCFCFFLLLLDFTLTRPCTVMCGQIRPAQLKATVQPFDSAEPAKSAHT